MRLAIAFLISSALYVGAVVFSECVGDPQLAPVPKRAIVTIEVITPPKIEPDEDEAVAEDQPKKIQQSFTPPVISDFPRMVLDTSFVQALQPPTPGATNIAKITLTMPPSKGTQLVGFGEVFEISKIDQLPEVLVQIPPDYPYHLRTDGTTGQVLVDCIVDSHGDVQNPFAAKSSLHEFEAPAVRAVRNWKFVPGQRRGRPVNTHVQIPILFTINKSPFSSAP